MKHWYKSAPMKGILLILEHIFAVAAAVCIVIVLLYPGQEYGRKPGIQSEGNYQKTQGFEAKLQEASHDILNHIRWRDLFESEGKYNPDKIVDIIEYIDTEKISGENTSGIAYTLRDLEEWGSSGMPSSNVVVCEKEDETFEYFTIEEFEQLQLREGWIFADISELDSDSDTVEEWPNYMYELLGGYAGYDDHEKVSVLDKEKRVVYKDCWNLPFAYAEQASTVDGKTLLQIANEDLKWNGKLQELYGKVQKVLQRLPDQAAEYSAFEDNWSEGNTNLAYIFADLNSGKLYTNRQAYTDINKISQYVEELTKAGKYIVSTPKRADFKTNLDTEPGLWSTKKLVDTDNYIYVLSVDTEYPIRDTFYLQNKLFDKYWPLVNPAVTVGIISIAGFFMGLFWLTCIAGRTKDDKEVHLMWFDRMKTEIGLLMIGVAWTGAVAMLAALGSPWTYTYIGEDADAYISTVMAYGAEFLVLTGLVVLVSCAAFFIGYLSLVRRIKARTLWKNSILKWLIYAMKKFFEYRSCTFKAAAVLLGFIIVHWIAIGTAEAGNGGWMFVTFLVEGAALYYIIRKAIAKQKLKDGIRHIAEGNVGYQIPLRGLKGDERDIATHINHIGEGLSKAVEQSMKDERLKTDLITNVSHDIKTPLTSIINYVDLLKRENIPDPKIQGYLDILEAKAQRLKTLTEDVVEASKISSGNITMEYMNINFVEMINQTTGEFAEKFEKRNLQIVLNVPEHPVLVRSDGRRMWRIIENIYNNAAKYAMEGTRVYADLVEKEQTVEFSLKNISEQPLNISADELTERFIRGDVSRSTEGSGLGLSIAKNLTQLQGGKFDLYLDGDLFKVTITFPKIVQQQGWQVPPAQ